MILDDLSFTKIGKRLNELDKKIDEVKKFENEKANLLKYYNVLEAYRLRKATEGKPLSTGQNEKAIRWFQKFPYLALRKGEQMIQKELARYSNEQSEDMYHGKQAKDLRAIGEEKRIDDYLRQFVDDTPKMPKAPQVGMVEDKG